MSTAARSPAPADTGRRQALALMAAGATTRCGLVAGLGLGAASGAWAADKPEAGKGAAAKPAAKGAAAPNKALIQKKYWPAFDRFWELNYSRYEKDITSGNCRRYYDAMYVHNALLNMYEATGEARLLERSLTFMEMQIALAKNIDKRGRRNWNATGDQGNYKFGPIMVPHLLYDLQATTEFARAARMILTTPALKAKYADRAQGIYEFMRDHIVEKWLTERTSVTDTASWLVTNADPLKNTKNELDDKPAMFARILMDMDRIVPEPRYASIYTAVLQGMKARLVPFDPAKPDGPLVFDRDRISVEFGVRTPPDTSHTNRHVYMTVYGMRNGKVITRREIDGLSKLLTKVMWNGSTKEPKITNFIDGSNQNFRALGPYANGGIWFGWDLLGAYDATVQQLGDALLDAALAEQPGNPTVDNVRNAYGVIGLSASLARNVALPG